MNQPEVGISITSTDQDQEVDRRYQLKYGRRKKHNNRKRNQWRHKSITVGSQWMAHAAVDFYRSAEKVIVVKTDTMRYDRGHKYLLTGSHSFKIKCVIAVNSNDLPGLEHLKQSQTGWFVDKSFFAASPCNNLQFAVDFANDGISSFRSKWSRIGGNSRRFIVGEECGLNP